MVLGWGFLAALCVLASQPVKFPGDEWALAELAGLRVGWLDAAAVAVTSLGNAGIGVVVPVPWIPMLAVAAVWITNRRADAVFLAAASLAPAINLGLKEVIARARPDAYLAVVEESGYAFPSGHAAFAAAFLGALVVIAGRTNPQNEHAALRRAIQGALLLLCVAVAASPRLPGGALAQRRNRRTAVRGAVHGNAGVSGVAAKLPNETQAVSAIQRLKIPMNPATYPAGWPYPLE